MIGETLSGGTALLSGTVTNSGTLLASASHSLVEITSGAVVNGGVLEVGNGIVDIQSGGSANVTFLSTGNGELEIADSLSNTFAYSGRWPDLAERATPTISNTSTSSPLLRPHPRLLSATRPPMPPTPVVTSGGMLVASIDLVGAYVTSDFHVSAGISGSVKITDPTAVGGGVQSANIALFGNYIAASFATAAGGQGGTLVIEATQTAQPPPTLTHPNA